MNKKNIAIAMLIPFACFATPEDVQERLHITQEQIQSMNADAIKNGFPIPGSGVNVIPAGKMVSTPEQKTMFIKERSDARKLGYINKSPPDIDILLNFKTTAKKSFSSKKQNSELKKTFEEVGLAWQVTSFPVPGIEMIGVAPAQIHVKDKGWSGFIAFFEHKNIGICHYIENNLKYSLGATNLSEEIITRDVNGKVTTTSITGQPGHGFVYDVNWYDDGFFHEMRCANKEFDKQKINLMIDLAKSIDNNS